MIGLVLFRQALVLFLNNQDLMLEKLILYSGLRNLIYFRLHRKLVSDFISEGFPIPTSNGYGRYPDVNLHSGSKIRESSLATHLSHHTKLIHVRRFPTFNMLVLATFLTTKPYGG